MEQTGGGGERIARELGSKVEEGGGGEYVDDAERKKILN